jgi:hypothetical protein
MYKISLSSSDSLFTFLSRAPRSAALFIAIIVKAPLVQGFAMALGLIILALEVPLPMVKQYSLYHSFILRVVLLVFQAFLTALFYQVGLVWTYTAHADHFLGN